MSGSVEAIDRGTVHRICSGQVVLSLAVAVKELVENSLDAGATVIEVRLRDHGCDLVEVVDNGSGVREDNFEGLTLKHHTSKISDFSDLEVGVSTFGFRGEALSSLCALSDLSVTTCHMTSKVGTRLEYDSHGIIKTRTPCARQAGTTVSLRNLFHSLPVRRKEFTKNVKREFVKMVQMLQGYCIVSTGVKITCHNQTGRGGRQLVLSTTGNSTLKDNITDVFGAKQFSQLVEMVQCSREDIEASEGHSVKNADQFRLTGYVSRCNHGYGRGSTDRQFFFFNNRPCEHSKLTKLVNEVYHYYNRHQYPFIVLSITADKEHVDVNVTPDKRKVMLHQEKALLTIVKVTLRKLFEPMQGLYDANSHTPSPALTADSSFSSAESTPSLKRFLPERHKTDSQPHPKQAKLFDCEVIRFPSELNTSLESEPEAPLPSSASTDSSSHGGRADECVDNSDSILERSGMSEDGCVITNNGSSSQREDEKNKTEDANSGGTIHSNSFSQDVIPVLQVQDIEVDNLRLTKAEPNSGTKHSQNVIITNDQELTPPDAGLCFEPVIDLTNELKNDRGAHIGHTSPCQNHPPPKILQPNKELLSTHDSESVAAHRDELVSQSVSCDLGAIAKRFKVKRGLLLSKRDGKGKCFRAKINPASNKEAENELRREISKCDFTKMEILGQFNQGFIITKLGSDLFIVDQHATDEKYNFERYQKETVINHQRLISPIPLELTAVHEGVVMDNLQMFEMNGFLFEIDHNGLGTTNESVSSRNVNSHKINGPFPLSQLLPINFLVVNPHETNSCNNEVHRKVFQVSSTEWSSKEHLLSLTAPPCQRIKLTSKPVCGGQRSLGPNDIDELVFLLTDSEGSQGEVVRPSAVRAYFASRACRSAVMIGTSLNKSEMTKIVGHMEELEQPWSCPHGRPTMRHLVGLSRIHDNL